MVCITLNSQMKRARLIHLVKTSMIESSSGDVVIEHKDNESSPLIGTSTFVGSCIAVRTQSVKLTHLPHKIS